MPSALVCVFCADPKPVLENHHAFARFDRYPVTEGHLLIIPKRHVTSVFELTFEEQQALVSLLAEGKQFLEEHFKPDGYTVGVNDGPAAGQTVPHAHVHVIPRRLGDVVDPRGGIRAVVPGKQHY